MSSRADQFGWRNPASASKAEPADARVSGATKLKVCLVECIRWDGRVSVELERLVRRAISLYNRHPLGEGIQFSAICDWNTVYLDVDAFGEPPPPEVRSADLVIVDVSNNHPGYLFGAAYALSISLEEKKTVLVVRPSYNALFNISRSRVPIFEYTTASEVEFGESFEQTVAAEVKEGVRRKIESTRNRLISPVVGISGTDTVELRTAAQPLDWLAILAKAIQGVPGGRMLLGPVMKIRQTSESVERNAQIDRLARSSDVVSIETLQNILDEASGDGQGATTRLLARTLAQLVENYREGGAADAHISAAQHEIALLPLAAPSDLVAQELRHLFASPALRRTLRTCATDAGIERLRDDDPGFIDHLVNVLPSQPPDVIRRFFRMIASHRDSELLAYIVNSLDAGAAPLVG